MPPAALSGGMFTELSPLQKIMVSAVFKIGDATCL